MGFNSRFEQSDGGFTSILNCIVSDLKFAPYQLAYDGLDQHYKDSGLNREVNNWHDVDDFNWLVKDKQSPHWSLLAEGERISHQI